MKAVKFIFSIVLIIVLLFTLTNRQFNVNFSTFLRGEVLGLKLNNNQDTILFKKNDSIILWDKNRPLTWDDFRGVPDPKSEYKALTGTKISVNHELYHDSVVYFIRTIFDQEKSWSIVFSKDLLNHEQLHFDISELMARNLRKQMSKLVSFSLKQTSLEQKNLYVEIARNQRRAYHFKYDQETAHGVNKEKQKEWEEKIAKELKALEVYSSPRVVIKRGK